jgi:hypothetical protein
VTGNLSSVMAMTPVRILAMTAFVCVIVARPSYAQADRAPGWLGELSVLDNAVSAGSIEQRQAQLAGIHKEVEAWMALNPGSAADCPRLPNSHGTRTSSEIRSSC